MQPYKHENLDVWVFRDIGEELPETFPWDQKVIPHVGDHIVFLLDEYVVVKRTFTMDGIVSPISGRLSIYVELINEG